MGVLDARVFGVCGERWFIAQFFCRLGSVCDEVKDLSLTLKPQSRVRAKISSVGAYVPPKLLTNQDLEKMVATNDQWIQERTGIRERHIVEKGVATSDLAVEAAKKCLERRGISADELEVIIVATVDAGHVFSGDGLPGAGQAGGEGGRGGSTCRRRARGFPTRCRWGAKLVESGMHKKVIW